jgi:hypothetical protein
VILHNVKINPLRMGLARMLSRGVVQGMFKFFDE